MLLHFLFDEFWNNAVQSLCKGSCNDLHKNRKWLEASNGQAQKVIELCGSNGEQIESTPARQVNCKGIPFATLTSRCLALLTQSNAACQVACTHALKQHQTYRNWCHVTKHELKTRRQDQEARPGGKTWRQDQKARPGGKTRRQDQEARPAASTHSILPSDMSCIIIFPNVRHAGSIHVSVHELS